MGSVWFKRGGGVGWGLCGVKAGGLGSVWFKRGGGLGVLYGSRGEAHVQYAAKKPSRARSVSHLTV